MKHIENTLTSLIERFGPLRPEVSLEHALAIYNIEKLAGLVRFVARKFFIHGMPIIRMGLVRKGGGDAPAWVVPLGNVPMHGTEAFRRTKFTLCIRQKYIEEAPFSTLVSTISHEMAHIVLLSVGRQCPHDEKEVDLIAMYFGFSEIHERGKNYQVREKPAQFFWNKHTSFVQNILRKFSPRSEVSYRSFTRGYLSSAEVMFATNLIAQRRT